MSDALARGTELLLARGSVQADDQRDETVNPLLALLLRRFPVVHSVGLDGGIARYPEEFAVRAVLALAGSHDLLQLLGRPDHAGIALVEGNNLEPVVGELGG